MQNTTTHTALAASKTVRGPILTLQRVVQIAVALEADPTPACARAIVWWTERDRAALDPETWKAHAAFLRDSRVGELLLQDPITEHGRLKPRGYAGDAGLMDRFYFGLRPDYEHGRRVSRLGEAVHAVIIRNPGAEAVRCRRVRLANLVDAEAARRPGLRVASIACGYLREATLSNALREGRLERWTCIDHDAECVRQIAFRHEAEPAVRPLRASIQRLLTGQLELGEHDLIYSAGLYDYLDDRTAQRLTARLFEALAPGGRLVIGNYALEMPGRGYIEAFMDWWLHYRDREQVRALAVEVPRHEVALASVESCDTGVVHYLDLRKHLE